MKIPSFQSIMSCDVYAIRMINEVLNPVGVEVSHPPLFGRGMVHVASPPHLIIKFFVR